MFKKWEHVNNMHRIIVPILLLLLIISGLIAGIYFTNSKKPENKAQTNAPVNNSGNETLSPLLISFIPNTIKLTSGNENKINADITLDAGTESVRSATIKILCDPKRVKNLNLTQKRDRYSALSYSFADSTAVVNNTNCEAELILTVPPGAAQSGTGIVAQITATVTGNTPTEIVINPSSTGTSDKPEMEFEINRVNLELN